MSELKHVYSPREVMTKAWVAARLAARGFGGRPAQYLREALRQAWFEARPVAVRAAIMNARVLAEVARITAEASARPVAAAYIPTPRHLRAFTRPAFTRPRLVADAYAVRETARFAAEAEAQALGLAA